MSTTMSEVVGLAAGFCTTVSFLPQVIKLIRDRDASSISLGMYVIFTVGVALWLIYGLILDSPSIIVANIVTLCLASIILTLKIRLG